MSYVDPDGDQCSFGVNAQGKLEHVCGGDVWIKDVTKLALEEDGKLHFSGAAGADNKFKSEGEYSSLNSKAPQEESNEIVKLFQHLVR